MTKKVIRDGKVAVLYSPGFGAGWSTWARLGRPIDIFDTEMVEACEKGDIESLKEIATRKYPGVYQGGLKNLSIYWVPKGKRFTITEYDGSESVHIHNPKEGTLA